MQAVMDHIVLNAGDVEALVRFYTEVLALEPERLEEFRQGHVPFPSVRLNADTVIDLAPKRMWEGAQLRTSGRPNLNHFCLTLTKPEWDNLQERLQVNGVVADGPYPRWGAHGNGTSVYFHDPEGNEIEARYYGE
jgi:catechol 2,3-dioxygenase-like lactoylglutathione lyase family enzyme